MTAGYGVSTALVEAIPSPELALAFFVEAGVAELEVFAGPDHLGDWIAHPAALRRLVEAAGMRVRSVHSPDEGWDNGTLDEAAYRASIATTVACFPQAAEVGAAVVICHPNKQPPTPFTPETYRASWARSRTAMEIFAEAARKAGVKMAVENLPARGQVRPGAQIAHICELIAGLGDHVGICLDAGHSNANGISAAADAREAGDKLIALHIQDNDGLGEDQHWLPGQGTTDWAALLQALDEIAYTGGRIFEVKPILGVEETLAYLAQLAVCRRAVNHPICSRM
jgi:sugar phosphate isomerase/epimerase